MRRKSIACVVVTYNRLSVLKEAIDAITAQNYPPDRVIIVDNNSTDGTLDWLTKLSQTRRDVRVVRLMENIGGAGGFYHGVKTAYVNGADWIWTMDDDCLPAPDALEKLLEFLVAHEKKWPNEKTGFLASRVNWIDGNRHEMNTAEPVKNGYSGSQSFPYAPEIRYSSFVSALFNRDAIGQVGFPIKEFFIYSDDVEFTRRITSSGFRAYYVETSQVVHRTGENAGITMDRIVANPSPVSRREYAVRNLIAVNRSRPGGVFKETARLMVLWWMLLKNKTPPAMQFKLVSAGVAGLFLNYKKWIECPLPSEKIPSDGGVSN